MKPFKLVFALVFLSISSCFADAIYFAVNSTPYDRQMGRVLPLLKAGSSHASHQPSLMLVNDWISGLRQIPYGYSAEWKTPSETLGAPSADCKAKAVALYGRMRAAGAANLRLVIGRRTSSSRQTHAWLMWQTDGGSFLLDPTFNYTACKSEKIGGRNYQPIYAYGGGQKFRAAGSLVAQN